jgi:hypothetical protein
MRAPSITPAVYTASRVSRVGLTQCEWSPNIRYAAASVRGLVQR